MNDPVSPEEYIRRLRDAQEWAEIGGWQVWSWGLPLMLIGILVVAWLAGSADHFFLYADR